MAAFEYTALDAGGRRRKGVLEADSLRQIRQLLRDQGLAPLSVNAAVKSRRGGRQTPTFGFGQRLKGLDRCW